jgi:AraC-like DNA-binding protein
MIILYNAFFFTLLFFCGFVALAQWRLSKDRAILWYLGYILSNFGFYLFQFWKDYSKLGNFSGLILELDTPLSYLSTVCYIMFISTVFQINTLAPKIAKLIMWTMRFYIAMLVLNLILQLLMPYEVWMPVHRVVRIILFPIIVWLAVYMFRVRRYFYEKLILFGTLAVLVGYLSALIVRDNHLVGVQAIPDFLHPISTLWGTIYLYDVKVGIAIDVVLFSWALVLRQKMLLQALVPPPAPVVILPLVSPTNDEFLTKLNDYLNEHYTDPALDVEQVSKAVFLSSSQTNRNLKKKTGLTTEQYMLQFRLEKALKLLMESDQAISQIVDAVGMKDLPHFSQSFKKKYGYSPREMRKIAHENADKTQEGAV